MADFGSSLPQFNLEQALAIQKLRDEDAQAKLRPQQQPNALMGGLQAGIQETQAGLYGAAGAVGTMLGIDSLKKWGDEGQARNLKEAQQVGRPDLEGWVTDKNWSQLPAYAVYQTAKWAPVLLGAAATEGIGGAAAVARTAPQLAARFGLSEAAANTAAKSMLQRGIISAPLSAEVAGAAAAGVSGVGEMYQNAKDAGIDTPGAAAGALALGLPYGALEMVAPRGLVKSFAEGLTGDALKRAAGGALKAGAQEMVTEGAQTGLEMMFRPDLSAAQKAENIVKGALTGGFVGGFAGGVTGALSKKPEAVTDQDNKNYVDKTLAGQNPQDIPSPTAPVTQPPMGAPVESSGIPKSSQSSWENAPKQEIVRILSQLEDKEKRKEADPADIKLMDVLRGELERRNALKTVGQENTRGVSPVDADQGVQNVAQTQANVAQPQEAPMPQQPQTVQPQQANVPPIAEAEAPAEQPNPRAETVEDVRAKVRSIISDEEGVTKRADNRFIRDLDVASEPALGERVLSKLENPKEELDDRTQKLAQYFGFMDESGKAFDLDQAIANADQKSKDTTLAPEVRQQAEVQLQNLNDIAQIRAEQAPTPEAATDTKQSEVESRASVPAEPVSLIQDQAEAPVEKQPTTRATPELAIRFADLSTDPAFDAQTQREAQLIARQLASLARKENSEMSARLQKRVAAFEEQMTSKESIYSQFSEPQNTQQGAQNADKEPSTAGVYAREPAQVSGPVGKGDALRTASTESLQQGSPNEKISQSSAQQITGEKIGTGQESSQKGTYQEALASTPPGSRAPVSFETSPTLKSYPKFKEVSDTVTQWAKDLNITPSGGTIEFLTDKDINDNKDISYLSPKHKERLGRKALEMLTDGSQGFSLTTKKSVADALGLSEVDSKHAYIVVKESQLKNAKDPKELLSLIAHELGHVHMEQFERSASPQVQNELLAAYKADREQAMKSTEDYFTKFPPFELGRGSDTYLAGKYNLAPGSSFAQPLGDLQFKDGTKLSEKRLEYLYSYKEWFAHQVARHAMAAPYRNAAARSQGQSRLSDALTKFFQEVADNLKKFFTRAKNQGYFPNETFSQYLAKVQQSVRRSELMQPEKLRRETQKQTSQQSNKKENTFEQDFAKAEKTFADQQAKALSKETQRAAESSKPEINRTTAAPVSRALPGRAASEGRSVLNDVQKDTRLSSNVKEAFETARKDGENLEPLNQLMDTYGEVRKVLDNRVLKPFHKPLADAWDRSVKETNPEIIRTALARTAKAADMLKPSESVIAALSLNRLPAQGQQQTGMSVAAVESIIRPVISRWSGLPKTRVVSENDPNLSEQDREFLKNSGVFRGYGAFTWQNEKPVLLLNADRLTPREVIPTLFHEALGHFGLRSAYGRQLRELMRDIYNTTPAIREAVDAYIAERPELQRALSQFEEFDAREARAQLTEEVLAEQSENGVIDQGIFSRVKAFVESFARMLGLRKGAFSKDEITSILRIGQQSALNPSSLNEFYANQTYVDPSRLGSPQPVVNTNVQMKDLATKAKKLLDDYLKSPNKLDNLIIQAGEARNKLMGLFSLQHFAERYGSNLPGVEGYYAADTNNRSTVGKMARLWSFNYNSEVALTNRDPEGAELVNKIRQWTAPGIHPEKDFNGQSKTFKDEKNPELLQIKKDFVAEANRDWGKLKTNPAALQVYKDSRTFHDMQVHSTHAVILHNEVMSSEQIPENIKREAAKLDPIANFKRQSGFDVDSSHALEKANKFFQDHVNKLIDLAQKYSDNAYGPNPEKLSQKEKDQINRIVDPLQALIRTIKEDRGVIKEYPYFHLGRIGDLFVSFNIREQGVDADGKPFTSVADRKTVQDALKKEGIDVQLVLASGSPKIFLKVDQGSQQDAVIRTLNALEKTGVVTGKRKVGVDAQNEFSQGLSRWQKAVLDDATSRYQQQLDDIKESSLTASEKAVATAQAAKHLDGLRDFMLSTLPSASSTLVAQNRKAVGGYMSDMTRASAHRAHVWGQSIASLSSRRLFSDAITQMKNAVAAEGEKPSSDGRKVRLLSSIVNEIMYRDAIRPFLTGRTWHDTLAAWNHAFFLSLSPSYVALQFTQLGVTLWPRLVQDNKNVSFLEAATTIAKVSPDAMKVVKAMIAQGNSEGSFNWADSPITLAALNRTNLDQDTKEFILRFVNDNNLDIGSASREQGRVIEDEQTGAGDLTLRVASSFGYYSEVATRLIAALSAKALYEKTNGKTDLNNVAAYDKMIAAVSKTVNGAMIDYSTTNTARLFGKMGFAGPLTKVMLTFYRYTAGLLEMLGRSINDGILNGAKLYPEAERADKIKGAQRFLMAHMTAMMVVSGSMGLPFASAVAAAINGLMGLFDDDDEPYDANASWRTFLASVFGEDMGEILAHGAGRAVGVEFSQRTSEADLLPFTKFLSDRRSWKEAGTEWAAGMFGAPFSMIANIADGASEVANGDVMSGMTRMAPNFIKGPLKAADMYMSGAYLDKKNNRIPHISPDASDILMQAFGFMPSELAEVKEKDRYAQVRKGVISREAADIRKNLATAYEQGDMEGLREWMTRAQEFTKAHPNINILKTLKGVLSRRAKERLGLSSDDLEQQQLYPF